MSSVDKIVNESGKTVLGVISTSPALRAGPNTRAGAPMRFAVSVLSSVLPTVGVPRPVPAEDLCHDPEIWKAYKEDPKVHPNMTFCTADSLLTQGDYMLKNPSKFNPTNIPVLVSFGSLDTICDPKAGEQFINDISTTDKTFKLYEGMKHELQNEPQVKNEVIQYYLDWMFERAK